jgi:hypothetical protein
MLLDCSRDIALDVFGGPGSMLMARGKAGPTDRDRAEVTDPGRARPQLRRGRRRARDRRGVLLRSDQTPSLKRVQ